MSMFNLGKSFSETFQGLTLDRLQEGAPASAAAEAANGGNAHLAETSEVAEVAEMGKTPAAALDSTKAYFGAWFQGAEGSAAGAEAVQRLRAQLQEERQTVELLQTQLAAVKEQLRHPSVPLQQGEDQKGDVVKKKQEEKDVIEQQQTQTAVNKPEKAEKGHNEANDAGQLAQLANKVAEQEAMIEALKQQLQSMESSKPESSSSSSTVTLESLNEMLLAERNSTVQLEQEVQIAQEKLGTVKGEVKMLAEKLRDMIKRYQEKQKQVQALEAELQTTKAAQGEQQSGLSRTARELQDQLRQRNNDVNALKSDLLTKGSVVASQEAQLKKLTEEVQRLTEELHNAQSEKQTASQSLTQQQSLLEEVQTAMSARAEAAEQENKQLQEALQTLEQSFASERSTLKTELQELQGANQQLSARMAAMESTSANDANYVQILKQERNEFSERVHQLTKQVDSQRTAVDNFDSYKKRAQATLKQANDKLAEVSGAYEDMKVRLEEQAEQLQAHDASASQLIATVEQLRKTETTLRAQVQELEVRRTEVEQDRERMRCDVEELQAQLDASNARLSAQPTGQMASSSVFSDDMERNKLRRQLEQEREQRIHLQQQLQSQSINRHDEPSPTASQSPRSERVTFAYRAKDLVSQPQAPSYVEVEGARIAVVPEPESSFFVDELRQQLDSARKEASRYAHELSDAQQQLREQHEASSKLQNELEGLKNFSSRQQALSGDENSAVNFEYLKNCVLRFMVTKDQSEQRRVSPVIATILQFTSEERQEMEDAMKASSSSIPVPFRLGRWT